MSATVLNRTDAVLVVIDVQERLTVAMSHRQRVLDAAAFLCKVAGITGIDVVSTRQYPRGLGDTEPVVVAALEAIENAGGRVSHVDKVAFDCFHEPVFCEALEATGRRQLLITGMESHICVVQTALGALERGYDVHVVADGCCSRDDASHSIAMDRLRAAGAVITVAESAAYELVGEAGTDEFRELLRAVKERG